MYFWDCSYLQLVYLILEISRESCKNSLFEHVIALSQQRIHGRLQSTHWNVPQYRRGTREPLHQELRKLSHQIQQNGQRHSPENATLFQQLRDLCDSYERIEGYSNDAETLALLKTAVRQSHDLCTSRGKTIEETISTHGLDSRSVCMNKHIRQMNKIGRYWGLCIDLAETSRRYRKLFLNIYLRPIPSYRSITIPLNGVESTCFVHAEIQLLTFYAMNDSLDSLKPRILGVSKSACYLCNLFIFNHGRFFITKTHGQLYEKWTVPDLADYGPGQLDEFRSVLEAVNENLIIAIRRERHRPVRQCRSYPLGSYVCLPKGLPESPVSSSVRTLMSNCGNSTWSPNSTPRARSMASPPGTMPPLEDAVSPVRSVEMTSEPQVPSPRLARSVTSSYAVTPEIDQISDVTVTAISKASSALSSTTVRSLDLPVQRTITTLSSLRVTTGNLSVEFEFDGPGKGQISIQSSPDVVETNSETAIDVRTMAPNEFSQLQRADRDDRIAFCLRSCQSHSLYVILEWL